MGKAIKKLTFTDWILLVALLLVGGFYEAVSCALSAAMCVFLVIRIWRGKRLLLHKGLMPVSILLICLGYGLTCIWAIDSGMALIGFFKFLPLILYLLCLWQEEKEGCILTLLPYVAAVMAVIAAVGMQIPPLNGLFSVSDRLAGFFQYPNTFALFLLVSQLLVLKKPGKKLWDYGLMLVLIAALLYTGSRTVFVVFALANIAMLFALSKRRVRTVLLILAAAACVLAVILIVDKNSVLSRYLTISFTESTFVGRVLYVVDGLKLLVKYPFGMGYMGYYYVQQSIQTGVYAVAYAHNDFFQLFLDIGWVPAVVFLITLGRWLFKKTVSLPDKIIVGALCLHSLFDFDLQYVSMFMLLILLLQRQNTEQVVTCKTGKVWKVAAIGVAVVSLYLSVALALGNLGMYQTADLLFPANTRNKLLMLEVTEDLEEANRLADEILQVNTHYFAPYAMKAKYAYSQGNFSDMIAYQNQALKQNPFDHTLYEDYCAMLANGVKLYQKQGDLDGAQICRMELKTAQLKLWDVPNRLSELGKMIVDQPQSALSAQLQETIRQLGGCEP